jgi:hypothetical protein
MDNINFEYEMPTQYIVYFGIGIVLICILIGASKAVTQKILS